MVRISFWTAVFLVLLRVVIGWHFLFEGLNKIRSANIGASGTNKVWSSEAYWREAEGPVGPEMRKQLGDPDQLMLERLKIQEATDPAKPDDPSRVPSPIKKEWETYTEKFVQTFRLDEAAKAKAQQELTKAQGDLVKWLRSGEKEVKRTSPAGPSGDTDIKLSTPIRILEYKDQLDKIREVYEKKLPLFGKDVEKAHLREMKTKADTMRADFQKDLDGFFTKLKDALAALVGSKASGFTYKNNPDPDGLLLQMLDPSPDNQSMPESLKKQWTDYAEFVKTYATSDTSQQESILRKAEERYVRWLTGQDEFTGTPRPESDVAERREAFRVTSERYKQLQAEAKKDKAPEKQSALDSTKQELDRLRASLVADIQRHTDTMKNQIGSAIPEDLSKGYVSLDKETRKIEDLDRVTRWFIAIVGGCIMLGFLTRPMCLAAAFFLLMTYLAHPALPWLPASPMNEGTYVFINKNVVEFFALMALATTASGRWLGIDALLARILFGSGANEGNVRKETRKIRG